MAKKKEIPELKILGDLAKQQIKLENDIVRFEEKVVVAKKELLVLSEEIFPEKMQQFELTDVTIKGRKIELINDFRCNFPSLGGIERAKGEQRTQLIKRKKDGIKWMTENDHTGLLKCKVTYEFGMGEEKMLAKFRERTHKSFPKLEAAESESIHPATLKKFLKELGEDGVDYPKETFGVSPYKRVLVTE